MKTSIVTENNKKYIRVNLNKNTKYDFVLNLMPIIVIPIISFIVGIITSEVQNKVGTTSILIGVVAIIIVLTVTSLCSYVLIKSSIERVVKEAARDIALKAIDLYDEKKSLSNAVSERLYTLEQILEIEMNGELFGYKLCEVVIITSNFAYDIEGNYEKMGHFSNVVSANVKKGIQYTYYVTKNFYNESYINELIKSCGDKLIYHFLSDDFIFLVKDFDFVIYTVEEKDGNKKRYGFMPLSELLPGDGDTKKLYHAPISDELINNLLTAVHNGK